MKKIVLALLSITLLVSVSVGAEEYVVHEGDSLWKIASEYETSVEAIVELNDIENSNMIYTGDILTLPGKDTLVKNWTVDGFVQAESVLYVPGHEWLYVSNVNEQGLGYISRVSQDGKLDTLKFTDGIPVALGLAYYDGHIYSASLNTINVIDITSGEIVKSILAENGGMINDITISPDGTLYATDSFTQTIYMLNGDVLESWYHSDEFVMLNGIFFDYGTLYVSNMNMEDMTGSVYKIDVDRKDVSLVKSMENIGAIDGISRLGNKLIASNATTRELISFTENKVEVLGQFEGGMADITVNLASGEVYIPYLESNKLESYTFE